MSIPHGGVQLKISLPAAAENKKQEAKFTLADTLSKMNASVEKVVFNFYYDGEETELPVEVIVKYKNKLYKENITSSAFILEKGYNKIEWKNLSNINWAKNGDLEYIIFRVGEDGDAARSDLYLKNIVIYNQKEGA